MPTLIRFNTEPPKIVTITDGTAELDFVIKGALTLAEEAHFLKRLETIGGSDAQNHDVWIAAIMTLLVMRQDDYRTLSKLPIEPIPLDATPEDVLGDPGSISVQFADRCFRLYLAEKSSQPLDERPKEIGGKPSSGKKSSTTSKVPSPVTPDSNLGSGSKAA